MLTTIIAVVALLLIGIVAYRALRTPKPPAIGSTGQASGPNDGSQNASPSDGPRISA